TGFFDLYEETPFQPLGSIPVANINDALVYDPSGLYSFTESGVEFGIQYLYLPDAATPVDEINLLGSGGEILTSIPVTGDLFSLF
ncbi:MAG: hypothetical protein JO259_12135, partial [Mycobacterium sp.]|nr:hypothetical protein [Mycobacterium sp.]